MATKEEKGRILVVNKLKEGEQWPSLPEDLVESVRMKEPAEDILKTLLQCTLVEHVDTKNEAWYRSGDTNVKDIPKHVLMSTAVQYSHLELVKAMLETEFYSGKQYHWKNRKYGYMIHNPLHLACLLSLTTVTEMFLKKGANLYTNVRCEVLFKSSQYVNALELILQYDDIDMLHIALANDMEDNPIPHAPPIAYASRRKATKCTRYLVKDENEAESMA